MTSFRSRFIAPLVAVVLAAGTLGAFAQTAAPPAVPAPAKPNCETPGDYPGKLASPSQVERLRSKWTKERDAYLECMKKYIAEQKALSDAYIASGNAAVVEFNDAVTKFNEQMKAAEE